MFVILSSFARMAIKNLRTPFSFIWPVPKVVSLLGMGLFLPTPTEWGSITLPLPLEAGNLESVSSFFSKKLHIIMLLMSILNLYFFTMPQKPKYQLKALNIDNKKMGERIASIRKIQGLTQSALSQKIGINQSLLSYYETGKLKLSGEMVAHLAVALKVSADKIVGINPNSDDIETKNIPLRLIRRLRKIEQLPLNQQNTLLKTIDMVINQ